MLLHLIKVECRNTITKRYLCETVIVPAKDRFYAAQVALDTFDSKFTIIVVRVVAHCIATPDNPIRWIALHKQTKVKADGFVIDDGQV